MQTGSRIMKTTGLIIASLIVGFAPIAAAQGHAPVNPDQLKWGPAPPALPKGAQAVVLAGDPSKDGYYSVRLKAPAGYKVPPHFHPTDEHVTVISGSFHLGMGDAFDDKKGTALKPGGFAVAPKGMHHYAWFTEESIIQVDGMGPFAITYVNPGDDPRKSN
jgi:quercetin dioxygenase-like cupin family protein